MKIIVTTFHPHHYQSQEDTTRGIGILRLEEKKMMKGQE